MMQLIKVKGAIGEMSKDPQQFLIESLHHAAYSNALQNPLVAPEEALNRIDGSIIKKFYHVSFMKPFFTFIYLKL